MRRVTMRIGWVAVVGVGLMAGSGRGEGVAATRGTAMAPAAEAFAEMLAKAEAGNTSWETVLGMMYLRGSEANGVKKDPAAGVRWIKRAAEKGDGRAQFQLGVVYSEGTSVPKDEAEAAGWYRKAAEQGESDAQFEMGVKYDSGRGVVKYEAAARLWYGKAAKQGDAKAEEAMKRLGAK